MKLEKLFSYSNCPNCTVPSQKEACFFILSIDDELMYVPTNPERCLFLIYDKTDKNEYLLHENENYKKTKKYFPENFDNLFKIS